MNIVRRILCIGFTGHARSRTPAAVAHPVRAGLRTRRLALALTAAVVAAGGAPQAVAADSPRYIGIDYMFAQLRIDDLVFPEDDSFVRAPRYPLRGLMLSGGYQFNNHLAVEARVGQSPGKTRDWVVQDDTGTETVPLRVKADVITGAYVKGILPVDPGRVHAYAMLGYAGAKFRESADAGPENADLAVSGWESSVSYAVGVELYATSRWGARVEAIRYFSRGSETLDALQIGAVYRF